MFSQAGIGCFLSLARTLSFTETARELYMTQQAVSRHIARLEEELGLPLFIRDRRSVRITHAGERFAALFSRFGRELDAALKAERKFLDDSSRTLRIGYLDWIDISRGVKSACAALETETPGLLFYAERHRQAQLNALLAGGKLDGLITFDGFLQKSAELFTETLFSPRRVLLASKTSPLAEPGATFADYSAAPFIKPQEVDESETEIMHKAKKECQRLGLHPRGIIVAPNIETAYTMVEMGQGVLLSTGLSRMVTAGVLHAFPLESNANLVCAWIGSCPLLLGKFIAHLKSAFAG